MLTLFTTAKPFRGHTAIIQRNALKSWTLLHSDVEVILFGDEEGSAEVARELGIRHESKTKKNEFGASRLDDLFSQARQLARHEVLCYVNCDILLLPDFCNALAIVKSRFPRFLMVGRRWDTAITEPLHFGDKDWETRLRKRVLQQGRTRGPDWIDYFVFSRGLYASDLPPFAVGRAFWDNWLVWKALASRHPVIDASSKVLAVHQNHDYGYHPQGRQGVFFGVEAGRNHELAGGWRHLRTIADATEVLLNGALKPNRSRHWAIVKRYARQAWRVLLHDGIEPAWFLLMDLTRPARRKLGLRAENLRRWRAKALPLFGKHP